MKNSATFLSGCEQTPIALKELRGVILFTASYMAAAVLGAWLSGNAEFAFYIVVMLILISLVVRVHYMVRLSRGVLWGLSIWGFLHMAGGLVPVPASWPIAGEIRVLYSLWLIPGMLKYDQITHAFGFGVTTWVCWQALCSGQLAGFDLKPTFGRLVLCVMAGMGFGALNEVIEFLAVLTLPETNVGGYYNTGADLVANLFGTIIAAALIRAKYRRSTKAEVAHETS